MKPAGEGMMPGLAEFEAYLRYELNRRPLTVRVYTDDLQEFYDFLRRNGMEAYDPALVTLTDIRAWLAEVGERGAAGSTLRRKTQSVRAYFRYQMKLGNVKVNPATRIVPAKMPQRLPEVVREEEMEGLLDEPGDSYDEIRAHLILNLLYSTGMRRAELAALEDDAIDLQRLEIRVTGKRDKQRIVPIAPELAAEIRAYREARTREYPAGWEGNTLLVHKEKPMNVSKIYRIVHESLQVTGARKRSPHVLRHTFASGLLNHGAGINSVKELLGHASLESTQIYTHLSLDDLRRNYLGAHPRTNTDPDNEILGDK